MTRSEGKLSYKTVGLERRYCGNGQCTWFRDIVKDVWTLEQKFVHPIYGEVTYRQCAERDIAAHDCRSHARAVRMLRNFYDAKAWASGETEYATA